MTRAHRPRIAVVGAGIGGLAAAIDLVRVGVDVVVLERASKVGGKMREAEVAGRPIDVGPTVLTMRWVFDELFADAGARFDERVALDRSELVARHFFGPGERDRLDLFTSVERSSDAIAAFAGPGEALAYRRFAEATAAIYRATERPFLRSQAPSLATLAETVRRGELGALLRIDATRTMWRSLEATFADARLRQLFARYATYVGSSPFETPATLNLVAHVEREGVHLVRGGMYRVAEALAALATELGVAIRTGVHVERVVTRRGRVVGVDVAGGELACDAVVVAADAAAVADGRFGDEARCAAPRVTLGARSLSALAIATVARASGAPLVRHNVFFSSSYEREFAELFDRRRLPSEPTVYVCAQDRGDDDAARADDRLLLIVNAPATGDEPLPDDEVRACETQAFALLRRHGLELQPTALATTTPNELERLFPATGGALYGRSMHGMTAAFKRPGARTKMPGLYLAGGSTHPGAGVPMAALSGRLAARAVLEDRASTARSRRAATPGGTSTA